MIYLIVQVVHGNTHKTHNVILAGNMSYKLNAN